MFMEHFKIRIKQLASIEGFLAIIYVILLLGMTVPYGFPLFFPFVFVCFIVFLIHKRFTISLVVFNNFGIMLTFFCIILYLLGLIRNDGIIYAANIRDLKNIAGLMIVAFLLGNFNIKKYNLFLDMYSWLIVPILTVVSILCLFNFHRLVSGGDLLFIDVKKRGMAVGASLSGSQNIFALGMFAGLLAAVSGFNKALSVKGKGGYLLSIILLVGVLILSGSRRAWIVLGIMGAYWGVKACGRMVKYMFKGLSGRLEMDVTKAIAICGISAILLGAGALTYKEVLTIERGYELKRLSYRFGTLFDEEGMFTKAFSKRIERWTHAVSLLEGYSFFEILFGKGFSYLDSFSFRFHPEANEGDPHNFFLSAALYSGLPGAIFIIFLIILGFFKLYTDRKIYGKQFILLFLIALVFIGIGANSIFSVRILPVILLTIFSVNPEKVTIFRT